MLLSDALQNAINEQIKNELYSAYLYLAMSAHFETANLAGFAKWMRLQAKEEQEHAMKFFDYVLERGGQVELGAIAQPPAKFGTPLEVFEQVLGHEQQVTAMIHNLYKLAAKEDDFAAQIMLQWFVSEQVEEEKNANDIMAHLKMIEERETAMLMLDKQLGKRGED